jgi:hypothetical protein
MELTSWAGKNSKRLKQRGMYIVELLIAMVVLIVGVLGCMGLIITAIGTNGRNRHQSNSTATAQMVVEKIMSVPANTSPTLTITDCAGNAQNVNTTGSGAGAGATLLASGDVDFTVAAPAGYSVLYAGCGTAGRQAVYDIRWNIKTLSAFAKLVTVSARRRGSGTDPKIFAFPVTIRSVAGQGN